MRLSLTTLLAFTLATFPFFSSQVSAIHPQVLSRREPPSSSLILSSRQHRVHRSILDVCINVNVDLLANASQPAPILGPVDLGSNIQLCLCLKDLDIFLDTNVDIKALIRLLGKNIVSGLITALINTSPYASQCSIPPHAHQTCNSYDPCHHDCDPHYVRVGDKCVCAPPYTSCNGDCDIFPKGCGTAVPRSFKARNAPITTITRAKAKCKPHETVCGIPGRENSFDFECIDINTAGDSCGGCMTPHPFPQADPVLHVFGTDCTRIPNAKNSECSGQHCIVNKCNLGWHPNLARDACILNTGGPSNLNPRKVLKREDSLTTDVVANAHVSSDLVAKIGAIVSLVSGLECAPSQIPAGSSSSAAVISDLLGGIVYATSTLIASTNVPSMLINLDTLLNISSLLSSTISSCGCGKDLGLTDLDDAMGNIVAALLNLKSWCAHNLPSDLNLSGLLSGLGLNNPTVPAVVSPDLVDQIKSLVGLVVGLAGVGSSLPPPPTSPSNLSSINTNIVNSIVNATVYIVNATTVPSLVSGIGALVDANDLASSLLDNCRCVSALGLGTFVADLAQVANAALRMQDWCDAYPVANISTTGSSSTGAPTPISNTDELSIDLGLSNLLGLLGPVENGVAISGTATNTLANDLLGGLAGGVLISTGNVPPVSAVTAVGGVLNPEFVSQLEGLVNLVAELQSSYTPLGPASLNPSTLLDPSLLADVVQKTANLFNSSTVISLVTNIDALVAANSALQTALTNCACVDVLGLEGMVNHLVLVTDAALGLKNWCSSNSLDIFRRVVSRSGVLLSAGVASATIGVPSPSTLPVAPSSQGTSDSIIIGLDDLLSELGLSSLKVNVEVDGLGNGTSSAVNDVLNGLGVGPANIRSRLVVGRHMVGRQTLEVKDRRQITADVDASVTSELLTKILA